MPVWAIADLHLAFGVPSKKMDIFGPQWVNWTDKIEKEWRERIGENDLVLIAGDISWAMRIEDVKKDLEWIDQLPGTKVMIRGNHDYWWTSLNKIKKVMPPSIHVLQNDAFHWNDIAIGGARLWDCSQLSFNDIIVKSDNPKENLTEAASFDDEKIWEREILRLEMSLKCLKPAAKKKIVMTHYPPISTNLEIAPIHSLLKQYGVEFCIFGHLHNIAINKPLFGEKEGINYMLTACDYLNFKPIKVLD